jgi:hypothetical protein
VRGGCSTATEKGAGGMLGYDSTDESGLEPRFICALAFRRLRDDSMKSCCILQKSRLRNRSNEKRFRARVLLSTDVLRETAGNRNATVGLE